MKIKIGIFVCILMLFVAPTILAEDQKKAISVEKAMEALCGTWFFEIGASLEKVVYDHDGTWGAYYSKMEKPTYTGTFSLEKAWKDSEDNIWLTYLVRLSNQHSWYLCKISNNGAVWERARLSNRDHPPTEIGPKDQRYMKAIRNKNE